MEALPQADFSVFRDVGVPYSRQTLDLGRLEVNEQDREDKKESVLKMSSLRQKVVEKLDVLLLNTRESFFLFFFTLLLTVAKELVRQGNLFNQEFFSNQQLQQEPQVRTETAKTKLANPSPLSFSSFITRVCSNDE